MLKGPCYLYTKRKRDETHYDEDLHGTSLIGEVLYLGGNRTTPLLIGDKINKDIQPRRTSKK